MALHKTALTAEEKKDMQDAITSLHLAIKRFEGLRNLIAQRSELGQSHIQVVFVDQLKRVQAQAEYELKTGMTVGG